MTQYFDGSSNSNDLEYECGGFHHSVRKVRGPREEHSLGKVNKFGGT